MEPVDLESVAARVSRLEREARAWKSNALFAVTVSLLTALVAVALTYMLKQSQESLSETVDKISAEQIRQIQIERRRAAEQSPGKSGADPR